MNAPDTHERSTQDEVNEVIRECCDCGHVHSENDCGKVRSPDYESMPVFDHTCPKCGCAEYFDVTGDPLYTN